MIMNSSSGSSSGDDGPDLFDLAGLQQPVSYGTDPHILARTDDPDTSKMAAESIETSRLERMVHLAIAAFGTAGCISSQLLAHFDGFSYSSITARFSALERKGLISCGPDKRPGDSGRLQRVMRSIRIPQ